MVRCNLKKLLRTRPVLMLLLIIISYPVLGQSSTPTVYIESNITAPAIGQQVTIPLKFKNLPNVGSVSLKIIFDTSVLDFVSITDNPNHGTFVTNSDLASLGGVHDTIAIAWFDTNPISFTDGPFVNLHFTYKGGTSTFHFLPSPVSSLSDQNGTTISNLMLNDGSIVPPTPAPTGSIGDYVWIDANGNGIQDPGEHPLANVKVFLLNGSKGITIDSTTTDAQGIYSFAGLALGNYKIKFAAPTGYVISRQHTGGNSSLLGDSDPDSLSGITDTVQIVSGYLNRYDIDAGMHIPFTAPVPTGVIGDYVWNDANGNGIQDPGEPSLANVTVKLLDPNNSNAVLSTATTDAYGNYLFSGLNVGIYKIQFVAPSGYVISRQHTGGNSSLLGDSDPDSLSGITDTVQIVSGYLNRYDIDAGMHMPFGNPVPTGSIGDYVWEDTNQNGIQNPGENPLANVKVRLLNSSNDSVLDSTTTDAHGNYLFNSLVSGSYKIQFVLLSGYVFSPKHANNGLSPEGDSDADSTTGKTDVIVLTAGQSLYSVDAGMFKPVVVVHKPIPTINMIDGIDIVPDSGQTYKYTLVVKNTGDADLFNTSVTDSIPGGLKYKSSTGGSSSGETTQGSNIVIYQLGTLAAGQTDTLILVVEVSGHEAEYKNSASLSGTDAGSNSYSDYVFDINFGSDNSGGGGSGVESRGNMAQALLNRLLRLQSGMIIPMLAKTGVENLSAQHSLQEVIPVSGPYASKPVETTPYDILGISNAVSSYAVDYDITTNESTTRRVAGIFSAITPAPDIYDHSKAVCDRLAGAQIDEIKLVNINGYQFYASKLEKINAAIVDYAISFSVYETGSEYYVQNKWTHDEYKAPAGATNVYNFQVWSGSYENSISLVKQILTKFASFKPLNYMNTLQTVPDTYIKNSYYSHDGKIHLTLFNSGSSKDVTFNIKYRNSQGDIQISRTDNYSINTGLNDVVISSGIISDANVYLTQPGNFEDEVYVSGGAYTYAMGPNSSVSSFNTSGYPQEQISNYPKGALVLAGGASLSGQLKDYVSVIRSLSTNGSAYDLSKYNSIRFTASGTGKLDVLLIMTNTKNNNYYHYTIDLTSAAKEYVINFSDFKELYGAQTPFDASKMMNIGFSVNTTNNPALSSFNFEVKDIAFYSPGSVTAVDDQTIAPKEFSLSQNYPNPFNPSTVIEFSVARKEHISLIVYNLLGQQVAALIDGELEAGKHSITFNADNLASGVYFYKLIGNSVNITKKMILLR